MNAGNIEDCLVVNNAEEMLEALNAKADYILITKWYKKEFLERSEVPMPEENFFSGARVAAGSPFFHLINLFSKKGTVQRKIDGKVQKYIMKPHGEDLLLYLRQLDY